MKSQIHVQNRRSANRSVSLRNTLWRAFSFLLALVIFGSATVWSDPSASAADDPQSVRKGNGEVTFIHWKKITDSASMPTDTNRTYYMWLAWQDNNETTTYCLPVNMKLYIDKYDAQTCLYANDVTSDYFNFYSSDFYTVSSFGMPTITYTGNKDKDNDGAKEYYIKFGDYYLYDRNSNKNSFGLRKTWSDDDDEKDKCQWGVVFHSDKTDYHKSADKPGSCCWYRNDHGGPDTGLMWGRHRKDDKEKDNTIYLHAKEDTSYSSYDWFYIWIGVEETFSAFTTDYVVQPGNVCNVDDRVIINEGVTVTVAPGAVLSIEGQMFNNGKIENYGTVLIQENACLCPFQPQDVKSGALNCYGSSVAYPYQKGLKGEGSIIVMPKAKLAFQDGHGDLIIDGGTLENYGYVGTGDYFELNGGTVLNSGIMHVGVAIKRMDSLKGTTITAGSIVFFTNGSTWYKSSSRLPSLFAGNYRFENTGVLWIHLLESQKSMTNIMTKGLRGEGEIIS